MLLPYGVKRVALFGCSSGTRRKPLSLLTRVRLEEQLSELLGGKVELVSESALSRYIRPYVEREKVVLYEAEG